LWVDGADNGSHVDQLGWDVAVDDRFQMGYPVPQVINTLHRPFELAWCSAQVGERFVERFVPEALLAGVVAAGQDEAPGSEGHCCKDVFMLNRGAPSLCVLLIL